MTLALATPARAEDVTAPMQHKLHERVALIDLGPDRDPAITTKLGGAIVGAGLELVMGDGVEDALAGQSVDGDAMQLASAMTQAQAAFGKLDCKQAVTSAMAAIAIGAGRQAAGIAVPELPRAWTYVLLCADRGGDIDAAMIAAARLRTLGGSADVPADVWAKYPEVDAISNRDLVPLTITADATGAKVWIDHEYRGVSPLNVVVPLGDHVIGVSAGTRRGWASGAAVKSQTKLEIPTKDYNGTWSDVAKRVASWNGKLPSPAELGWVMGKVHARVAVIRSGDTVQAWGRLGLAEAPHPLGGDDAVAPIAEAQRVIALVVNRSHAWNDHAPDPDRELLTEDQVPGRDGGRRNVPTRWWVYASLIGAIAAGAIIIYAHDAGNDVQRVELKYP
jgi:PEGA domain-containing protein